MRKVSSLNFRVAGWTTTAVDGLCENSNLDATALRRGESRSRLQKSRRTIRDATGLPVEFHA